MAKEAIETVRLLVVSREPAVLCPLWSMGDSNSWQVESVANGWGAMERVRSRVAPNLLLLDLRRGDTDGLHTLSWLHRLRPELPIILICDSDDSSTQQEAMRLGATDFLVRPLASQPFETVIRRHLPAASAIDETDITSDDVELISGDVFFVAASPLMRNLRTQAELLAVSNVPVLILGESGSGKETAARLIHRLSVRSGFEFAKVNCAALPSDLLEIELFGCKRNGTEPPSVRPGKLDLCEKGTLFVDEVTEMPMALQHKLLEIVRSKRFVRPGNGKPVEVDVRILASSTASVESAISNSKLREDLYYQLSAYTIHVPPLRQRLEEIPILLRHFMQQLAKHYGLPPRALSAGIVGACQSHSWSGNLRELEGFVKRYLMAGDKELTYRDNQSEPQDAAAHDTAMTPRVRPLASGASASPGGASSSESLKSMVQSVKLETERNAIAEALECTRWNRKAAARLLQVSYRTLLYKIEQYHMTSAESALRRNGAGSGRHGSGFGGNGGVH